VQRHLRKPKKQKQMRKLSEPVRAAQTWPNTIHLAFRLSLCSIDLANTLLRLPVLHDVYLDLRGLVHPRHRVAVEIGLLNTAVLQSNLAVALR